MFYRIVLFIRQTTDYRVHSKRRINNSHVVCNGFLHLEWSVNTCLNQEILMRGRKMNKYIYMFFSPARGKVISQILSLLVIAIFSFVLLILLSCAESVNRDLRFFKDKGITSVIWANNDLMYMQYSQNVSDDLKHDLVIKQNEKLSSVDGVETVVEFSMREIQILSNKTISKDNIVFSASDNEYFEKYWNLSQEIPGFGESNTAVFNDKYKNEFKVGDTLNIVVPSNEYKPVEISIKVAGFENCSLYVSGNRYVPDVILSNSIKESNGEEVTMLSYYDCICVIPTDSVEKAEIMQ